MGFDEELDAGEEFVAAPDPGNLIDFGEEEGDDGQVQDVPNQPYDDPFQGDEEEEVDQPGPPYALEDEEQDYVPPEDDQQMVNEDSPAQSIGNKRRLPQRRAAADAAAYMPLEGEGEGDTLEEAIEEGQMDGMFGRAKKKNRYKLSLGEIQDMVTSLLNKMEDAAQKDLELHSRGEPAIEKLKMIPEIEQTLIRRDLQYPLLEAGLLGVFKAWIEPLSDGTLPNTKVRSTVLKMLKALPVDTREQEHREQLKMSQIGSRVMFLSRISAETRENKKIARELVEKWARPIFEEARDEEEEKLRIRDALDARKRRMETEKEEETRKSQRQLKPGDPGYRYTASIPAPSRLDYVIKPVSRVSNDLSAHSLSKKNPVMQRLNKIQRKRQLKSKAMQASRPSIEGKGM